MIVHPSHSLALGIQKPGRFFDDVVASISLGIHQDFEDWFFEFLMNIYVHSCEFIDHILDSKGCLFKKTRICSTCGSKSAKKKEEGGKISNSSGPLGPSAVRKHIYIYNRRDQMSN